MRPIAITKLPEIITIATENVQTDSGLGFGEMFQFGQVLRSVPKSKVRMAMVPADTEMIGDISYDIPVEDKMDWLLDRMKHDEPFEITKDELANAEITIDVLNGSGTAGRGQAMADDLKAKGFTIGVISNADSFDYGHTQIHVSSNDYSKAKRIKDSLGVGDIVSDGASGSQITVIVGRDFTEQNDPSDKENSSTRVN